MRSGPHAKVFCAVCGHVIALGGDIVPLSSGPGLGGKARHPTCVEIVPAAKIPVNTWIRVLVQGRGEISVEVCAQEGKPKPHTTTAKDLRGTLYLVRSRFGTSGYLVGYDGTEIKP